MQLGKIVTCFVVFLGLLQSGVRAEETYFRVPVADLTFTDGASPERTSPRAFSGRGSWRRIDLFEPRIILEGSGEAYYHLSAEALATPARIVDGAVVVRLTQAQDVRGRLVIPKADGSGMVSRTFVIPAARAATDAKRAFYQAKWEYDTAWAGAGVAGAAWFRHQANATREVLATLAASGSPPTARQTPWWRRQGSSDLEETYALMSGGRALSENLQLDRLLPPVQAADLTVDVASLPGIDTVSLDWKALVQDRTPVPDPLAALLPEDQHALFFPTFHALLTLMDEANAHGTPVLQFLEPRSEDAHTRERYERQLCLGTSNLTRLLGPMVVSSVAITGSDPYLRMGSDVVVLFETKNPTMLQGLVSARHAAAMQENPAVQRREGEVQGLRYTAAVSPDRVISSYMAVHDKVVIVTNSLPQLQRLAETVQGKRPALAMSQEYRFFRDRYPHTDNDEAAFLLLTDATIRRWCSAVWRIADSRRTRMAAALAELYMRALPALVQGTVEAGPLETTLTVPEAGAMHMTARGPVSATYGSLDFLTPIIELPITKVTQEEARVYERFRVTYQQNWRQFFDPIAVRFKVQPERLSLDLTVMPLIAGTEYRDFIDLTRNATLQPTSGDPHPEALWHLVMALNPESSMMKQFGSTAGGMIPGLKTHPLAWLGNVVAFYADDDPLWEQRLQDAKTAGSASLRALDRLPIALHGEVKDALGLTVFLAALRAFVEQAAPGMAQWETLTHQDLPYVKVSPSERARASTGDAPRGLALYYAASGDALVISLNEALVQRALERQAARAAARTTGSGAPAQPDGQVQNTAAQPWLGMNLALRVARKALTVLTQQWEDEYRQENQTASWLNLLILNEWKRLFPQEDPVTLHERLWGITLQCPGGGSYVWDETWQTMASTVYGHPAVPQAGPGIPQPLAGLLSAAFGLTFEHEGLRAQVEMTRKPGKP